MTTEEADIKELAIALWRLERWLDNTESKRKMAARSALRSIRKYISALGIEIIDPIGSKFDPGLAVEVMNNESEDADEGDLIIIQCLTPYIYQNGELIQRARVIVGTGTGASKSDDLQVEIKDTSDITTDETADKTVDITDPDMNDDKITINENSIERIMKYAKNI